MRATELDRPVEILLVEDNPGDAGLVIEAFQEAGVPNNIEVAGDGEEAMAFLRRGGKYADAPRPDLILLDLNLPRKDGREVLQEVKTDRSLKLIPVVVLSTSRAEEDILRTYDLHANCYVTKPLKIDEIFQAVATIEGFWLRLAHLPGGDNRE